MGKPALDRIDRWMSNDLRGRNVRTAAPASGCREVQTHLIAGRAALYAFNGKRDHNAVRLRTAIHLERPCQVAAINECSRRLDRDYRPSQCLATNPSDMLHQSVVRYPA